jgi:Tfp pilus assembly protein PilZ
MFKKMMDRMKTLKLLFVILFFALFYGCNINSSDSISDNITSVQFKNSSLDSSYIIISIGIINDNGFFVPTYSYYLKNNEISEKIEIDSKKYVVAFKFAFTTDHNQLAEWSYWNIVDYDYNFNKGENYIVRCNGKNIFIENF